MPLNSVVRSSILFLCQPPKAAGRKYAGSAFTICLSSRAALDRYEMPRELRYLPVIESALEPQAVHGRARGIWQFMGPTARAWGGWIPCRPATRPLMASNRTLQRVISNAFMVRTATGRLQSRPTTAVGQRQQSSRRTGGGKHDFWDIYPYLTSAETRGYVRLSLRRIT